MRTTRLNNAAEGIGNNAFSFRAQRTRGGTSLGLSSSDFASKKERHLDEQWPKQKELEDSLEPMVETIVRSLRSGHNLSAAVQEAVAVHQSAASSAFRVVLSRCKAGVSLAEAFREFAFRYHSAEAKMVGLAFSLAAESGAGLTQALDTITASLRERRHLQSEVDSLISQARFAAQIMVGLPAIMFVLRAITSPGYFDTIFNDPFNRMLILVGLALDAVGFLWMQMLVRRVLR